MPIKLLFLKTIHSTASLVKNLVELFMVVLQYLLTIHSHIQLNTSLQAIAIRATYHRTISVCSIYLSPSAKFTSNDLDDLLSSYLPLFYCSETSTLTVLYGVARKQMYEGSWSKTCCSSITFHY